MTHMALQGIVEEEPEPEAEWTGSKKKQPLKKRKSKGSTAGVRHSGIDKMNTIKFDEDY